MYCEQCRREINPRKSLCAVCNVLETKTSGNMVSTPFGDLSGLIDEDTKEWIINPVFDDIQYNPSTHEFLATGSLGVFKILEHYENGRATVFDVSDHPLHMTRSGLVEDKIDITERIVFSVITGEQNDTHGALMAITAPWV